ncbi:hypothetical protein, partial [Enterobacter cloacae complex sp. GF14B]|uniref:hypothetical protein n=1 Tax=Enterobacter cloacae complex sp. GF14B TaxID=2511982 RepID=UPI0011132B91
MSTKESVTRARLDPLPPIIEEGSDTDTSSDKYFFMMGSQQPRGFTYDGPMPGGSTSQNPLNDSKLTVIFLEGTNSRGALVYSDYRGRKCICIEERPAQRLEIIRVYDDGDRFRDKKGNHYLIVSNPEDYNRYGDNVAKGKMVSETQEPPPNIDRPGAIFMYDKKTTRVSTYNQNVGIYKHESEGIVSYFRCKEPYPNELSKDKVLYLFSYENAMGKDIVFVDRYGREYKHIHPEEVEKATLPEKSTYAPEEVPRVTYTPSKSTNPFSEEYDATSHSNRQQTFNYQNQQATQPSLQAWLRQSATLEQDRNRGGDPTARGLRELQEPPLYSQYQGESKPKTQESVEPGRQPTERVRRDEPPLARTIRNYGLAAPLGEEPSHYQRPEEV